MNLAESSMSLLESFGIKLTIMSVQQQPPDASIAAASTLERS